MLLTHRKLCDFQRRFSPRFGICSGILDNAKQGVERPRGSPDFEELLRGGQDRLRGLLRGNLGGRGFALIALAAIVLWGFSGFFRVEPDELGVVLRFGKFVREVPQLPRHWPAWLRRRRHD
jgi:regulator of protease activity HflC (stomatin/prohibitin superfamily)